MGALSLGALPVIGAGLLFGRPGGVSVGLLILPLDIFLLSYLAPGEIAWRSDLSFWLTHLAFILVGTLVDYQQSLRWGPSKKQARRQADEETSEVKGMPGFMRDIRTRMPTQELLALQAAALNAAANAILITDVQGIILWVNPAFTRLTGYAPEEALGRTPRLLRSGKHDRAFYQNLWQTILAGAVWQGELYNRRKDGGLYMEEMTVTPVRRELSGEIGWFVAIKQDISPRVQAEQRLQFLATHDTLTELPNRSLFQDRLRHALKLASRNESLIAVLFLDLDDFKPINDKYGHETGDRVLQMIAKRLLLAVRESDTLARFGGDEFVVLLENIPNREASLTAAEKISASLAQPYQLQGEAFTITTSIGISIFPEHGREHGREPRELLKKADAAMYRVKQKTKNGYQIYSGESQGEGASRPGVSPGNPHQS